jgi:hypothetical protein
MNHVNHALETLSSMLRTAGEKGEISDANLRIPYLDLLDTITEKSLNYEDVDLEISITMKWVDAGDLQDEVKNEV